MPCYLIWRSDGRERLDSRGNSVGYRYTIYRQRRNFSSREEAERHARRSLIGAPWWAVVEGDTFEEAQRVHNSTALAEAQRTRHSDPNAGWNHRSGFWAALRARLAVAHD